MSQARDESSGEIVSLSRPLSHFYRWTGGIIMAFGILIMVSWHEHWQHVLQLIPNTAPMQFNTALCFVLSGAALFLLTTQYFKGALPFGSIVVLLPLIVLAEYATGWNSGLDVFFFKPYFEAATSLPGRMSPLAAVCFIMIGAGICLFCSGRRWHSRYAITGILAFIVGVIAVVALVGFAFDIESAYGWGAYSSIAVNTSAMFVMLSFSMLGIAWQKARQENHNFVRWLPVTGSITMMMMVAFVAMGDMKALRGEIFWRKHTIQVIFSAEELQNELIDLQRGMRGFVTKGDPSSLDSFQTLTAAQAAKIKELLNLTADNLSQQQRLKGLSRAVDALLTYDNNLIALYREQGPELVFKMDTTGQGRVLFGNVNELLKTFVETEQRLLDMRDLSEETGYRNTERLLIFGCGLAAALLLIANFMASYALAKRQRAEDKLARHAEALSRSNAELAQFAYVASHDMREPLRTISSFTQILQEDFRNKVGADADETISHIVRGTKRMTNIIDDLLALSSIGSQKNRYEKASLEQPLKVALENLSVAIKEKNAVVKYDFLPATTIDVSQVSLLFQNLIGNAIKFCSGRTPEVQISATREPGGFWKVSVKDNGIGIDPKYADKIFGIFQRLHSREAYPGTGIGLAICKKIVERHGGKIWLESIPGSGATFHFTLADNPEDKLNVEQ